MSIRIIERNGREILGAETRADQLLEWSSKNKRGARWVKDFPFGLRLGLVADGDNPKVYIHWNQEKFNSFLKTLGTLEEFSITAYGVRVDRSEGVTIVRLLGAGQSTQTLWDSDTIQFSREQEKVDVNWLVGMLKFSDDGPLFFTAPESQEELEESSAVAIISNKPVEEITTKPKKTASQVLKRPELTTKAKAYLLQDLALSKLIGSKLTSR